MVKNNFKVHNQAHIRALSDNYKYNFSNNDMFYSGPNTLENHHYFEYKTKTKNTGTFDKRNDFSSPKLPKNSKKEYKAKDSAKSEYLNGKPFEYKFKHSKQESIDSSKQGHTFDYSKPPKDPVVNFTSSHSNENRSKLKNKKNSSKIATRTRGSDSISPKAPLNFIHETPNLQHQGSSGGSGTNYHRTKKDQYEKQQVNDIQFSKCLSQPNLDRLQILEKLKNNYINVPLVAQVKKGKVSVSHDKADKPSIEKEMISRFSIKEGNSRLEKKFSGITERQENKPTSYESQQIDSYRGQNILSPIIMETSEDENNPIDDIKSSIQCASGNKFSNSSNKVTLIKNLKRNGDFNEGIKEITSTDSRFDTPPKFSTRDEFKFGYEEKKDDYRKSLCRNPQNDKKFHNFLRGLRQRL